MTTRYATNTRLDLTESDDKRHEPTGKRPTRKERSVPANSHHIRSMKKYIRVTMPDGTLWDVPAGVVAKNRADYYEPAGTEKWCDEYNFAMDSRSELFDWAANNMDWDDVAGVAQKVGTVEPDTDYQEGWVNGGKEIITK